MAQVMKNRDLVIRGRKISPSDIEVVCRLVEEHRSLGRRRIAQGLCALWDWRAKNGALKERAAQAVLTELARRGWLVLPRKRTGALGGSVRRVTPRLPKSSPPPEVRGDLAYQLPLRVERVVDRAQQDLWREVLVRYHYLGHVEPVGASVKHLVYGRTGVLLAALGWQSAVTHLACRDRIIGWDAPRRAIDLDRVATNVRFLILPWAHLRNAASAILSQSIAPLRADWWARYKVELGLLETFVDPRRFDGACYRAANWVAIGQSKGYAKQQGKHIYHGQRKEVYVYILDQDLRRQVLNNPQEPALNRAYLLSMYRETQRSERSLKMSVITACWEPKPAPEIDLDGAEVKDTLVKELEAYHRLYEDAFARVEQIDLGRTYWMGLMSQTARKNVEAMALHMRGPELVRNLQRFMTEQKWDAALLRQIYWRESAATLAEPGGVLSLDASEIGKKGRESVGVAPQYCGRLGKIANCQSGVYICYASSHGHTLLQGRLYLPECWLEEAYAERRQKCRVPEDVTFQTKPQIASAMLQEVYAAGLFPCQWVAVDASFGNNEPFLQSLPAELLYLADISCTRKVWLPTTAASTERESYPVSALLEKPGLLAWEHYKVAEGEKGPVVADFARLRVCLSAERIPENERWLLVCNRADETLKYSLSNAPWDTPIEEMVRVSRYRWPIERSFQEGKGELGMDHYEHRSWPAWHRHMLFVCLAQLFLTRIRLTLKKKASTLTLPQCCLLIQAVLPVRPFDWEYTKVVVAYTMGRNYQAYVSHRKTRITDLNQWKDIVIKME